MAAFELLLRAAGVDGMIASRESHEDHGSPSAVDAPCKNSLTLNGLHTTTFLPLGRGSWTLANRKRSPNTGALEPGSPWTALRELASAASDKSLSMSEGNLGELKERSSSPQGAKLSCSTAPDSRSTETCQRHKFRRSNSGSRAASSPDMQHYTPGQGGDRRSDLQADTVLMPQSDSQQGLRNGYQQMPQWCRDFEAPHSQAGRLLRTESKPKYTSRILAGDELSSLVEIGNRLGIVTPTAEEQLAAPQLPKRLFGRYQSVYKGIRHRRSKNKKMLKWDVIFHAGGVLTKLGTYEDEALGARVWDLQALRVRGAFTWINFPHLRNFYLAELSKIGEKVQGSDEALACQRPLACEVVEPPAVQHRPPATLIVPMNESQHSEGKAVSTAPEAPPPAAVPTQTQPCNLQIPTPGTPQTMSARPPAPAPQLEETGMEESGLQMLSTLMPRHTQSMGDNRFPDTHAGHTEESWEGFLQLVKWIIMGVVKTADKDVQTGVGLLKRAMDISSICEKSWQAQQVNPSVASRLRDIGESLRRDVKSSLRAAMTRKEAAKKFLGKVDAFLSAPNLRAAFAHQPTKLNGARVA